MSYDSLNYHNYTAVFMNRVANCSVKNIIWVEKWLPPWFYVPSGTLYVSIFFIAYLTARCLLGLLISHIKIKFVCNTTLNYSPTIQFL